MDFGASGNNYNNYYGTPTGGWQPTAYPFNGVAPLNTGAANNDPRGTMAQVINSMSLDFFNTAVPLKDDLVKMSTYNGNTGVVDKLKTEGMSAVGQSFDKATGAANRNAERYGMQQTAEQKTAQDSALASGRALGQVDANNGAVQFQKDFNKQIVSGMGSPTGITKQ
jgi:hypothetical protein